MSYIRISLDHYPIVVIETEGAYDEEQAKAFAEDMHDILLRRQRHCIVASSPGGFDMPTLGARTVIHRFIEEHSKLSTEFTAGAAVVIKSLIAKVSVSALFRLQRTSFPMKAFRTHDEAMAWAAKILQEDTGPYLRTGPVESDFHVND